MTYRSFVLCILAFGATAALAHQGVKNPAVKARMDGMSAMADNVKVLGDIAKGQTEFDRAAARAAARTIARHSAKSIILFTPRENDPKSEALPAIWDNFDDFTAKARALETLASDLSTSINGLEDVLAAMGPLGATCSSCHRAYRE